MTPTSITPSDAGPGPRGAAANRPTDGASLEELVQRMVEGGTDAVRELYRRLSPLVYSVAYRVTGTVEDAEEVLVDTFHQAWGRAAVFDRERATVEGWLLNIARSRAIDRIRARRRWQRDRDALAEEAPAFPTTAPPNPEKDAIRSEERERLHQALAELPGDQRRALELAYFAGLSHSEIAERLGQPLGTVKTRVRLAMEKIRKSLSSVEGSEDE